MSPETIRLLLVEDNPDDASLIKEALAGSRATRFSIARTERLDDALAKLADETFDAALVALTLPDSRGLETFRRLNAAAPSLPIVIMTGLDGQDAGVQAVKEGAQDYLVKGEPAAEALVRAVRHAVERNQTIAQLRESEEKNRRQRERLSEAQSVAKIGSWETDLGDMSVVWADETHRIFETDPGAFLPDHEAFLARVHPDDRDRVNEAFLASITNPERCLVEHRIVLPDGRVKHVEERWRVHLTPAGSPARAVGTCQDVTERKESERRLKEAEAMLLQGQKMEAMGRLAGGVAHDFNNILTAILGLAEITLMTLPAESPIREDIEEIRKSGLRAANLTQQLLAFSRRQVTSPRVIDLDDTVTGLAKMLRRIIGEHVELVIEPGTRGATIKADPGQIEQLVMNLAVNARDAMPRGGTITIRTGAEEVRGDAARPELPEGRYATLTVSDTGTGMTDEVKQHLFEPFFTTKEKGTGLGLSTCYGVVKQNAGTIDFSTAEGAGTTFKALFPCSEARPMPEPHAAKPALPSGGEVVLVIEDEEPVRRLTTRILTMLGYTVREASDGAEGLAHLEKDDGGEVHLILTDMVMPKMSGWELAQRAAVIRPDVPVLFVSGYTDDIFEGMCVLDATIDILPKPFTALDLAARVRRAIDQRR